MNPSAIQGVEVVSDGEAGITLRHPQRGEVQLRGVAAAVWRNADGARSVAELAAAAGAEESSVWAALDELGDADLLSERVAAPAGIHENVRREVVFASDATDADAAGKLEAQFDAEAAKGGVEIELPQAEERRKQQEAAQDAEEQAASEAALAALDSRGSADGVMIPDAAPGSADGVMIPDAAPGSADGVMIPDAAPAAVEAVNVEPEDEKKSAD